MSQPRPNPLHYLRATLFWLAFTMTTIVYVVPLGILVKALPKSWPYPIARSWAVVNLWALRLICGLHWRVRGLENVPDEPVIVFSKHQSTWETLGLAMLLPPQVWVIKRELLKIPLFGWGFASVQPIAIDRSAGRAAVEQMVDQGQARLADGRFVIIFPEGTRVRPGQQARYKMGGAVLAVRSGRPVLPVAHNAGEFWPRGSFVKWPGCLDVVIGEPIPTAGKTAEQINREAGAAIEGMMAEISGRGPAAAAPSNAGGQAQRHA